MYTVIGSVKSRAFRVMWMLEELGQSYDLISVGPGSEEARKYNPSGKIPALVDGEDVLTDSATQLANRLDGPFLMGDAITVPDLLAVHCINWSIGAGFDPVDERLGEWAAGLRKRGAFKAVRARDSA